MSSTTLVLHHYTLLICELSYPHDLTKTGVLVDLTSPPPCTEGSELATLTTFTANTLGSGIGLNPLLHKAGVLNYLEQLAAQQVDRDDAKR